MKTVRLGSCDTGKRPSDAEDFLTSYHDLGILKGKKSFRDEDRGKWNHLREVSGQNVAELQQFLFEAGFMGRMATEGIFDYITQASTRLFQEYVRTVEKKANLVPDGIVGPATWNHIERWKSNGQVSEWGTASAAKPTPEYSKWMGMLKKAKDHYSRRVDPILNQVNTHASTSDTIRPADWNTESDEIHLIGIRRNFDRAEDVRTNDDVFILLIKGLVFKFWGSTDPNQQMADRTDEAFLVEGQHLYRFGWHKMWSDAKVYRALKPFKHGVLVFRDRDDNNALNEHDLNKGLDNDPNRTINIHWSGIGSSNWSAGCQVLVGKSYINHLDEVVDCSSFAARNYGELNNTFKKTKGAYNLCADLVLSYAEPKINRVYYTLGREESLDLSGGFSGDVKEILDRLKS